MQKKGIKRGKKTQSASAGEFLANVSKKKRQVCKCQWKRVYPERGDSVHARRRTSCAVEEESLPARVLDDHD